MNLEIREMKRGEESLAWKTGKPSFGLVEGLAFRKPEQAFLAILDGQIVGMASYLIFPAKDDQRIGYVETGYVKRGYEGKGIGSALYQKATDYLKEQGCETVTATVKDDNVASWKLFENNGYHIIDFLQMLQSYGLIASIRLWAKSSFAIATGFHLWSTMPAKGSTTIREMGIFMLLNLGILLLVWAFTGNTAGLGWSVCAFALLLAASLLGGAFAVLLSKEVWYFRTAKGGLLISVLVTGLGGIWPIVGRFYPVEYKRTKAFRRSMGLEGLFEWMAILLLVGVAAAFKDQAAICRAVIAMGSNLLLFHSIPVYPFECFGGRRIWDYNKGLSVLTVLISLVVL